MAFVTDQRAWNVDNPETLKGHEGHYVGVNAHVYADKDSIHITEVKMPTASESTKNDIRYPIEGDSERLTAAFQRDNHLVRELEMPLRSVRSTFKSAPRRSASSSRMARIALS